MKQREPMKRTRGLGALSALAQASLNERQAATLARKQALRATKKMAKLKAAWEAIEAAPPAARAKLHRAARVKAKGKGKVSKIRAEGNRLAREHYFRTKLIRPCQSCGTDITLHSSESHHKAQKGEELTNKLICCDTCHKGFIHDLNHPEHRKAAMHSPANAVSGGKVAWGEYGLLNAFLAFRAGRPQPKGYTIPAGPHKGKRCQGCTEQESLGLKVWAPCILHQAECHDGLFAAPTTEAA